MTIAIKYSPRHNQGYDSLKEPILNSSNLHVRRRECLLLIAITLFNDTINIIVVTLHNVLRTKHVYLLI